MCCLLCSLIFYSSDDDDRVYERGANYQTKRSSVSFVLATNAYQDAMFPLKYLRSDRSREQVRHAVLCCCLLLSDMDMDQSAALHLHARLSPTFRVHLTLNTCINRRFCQ